MTAVADENQPTGWNAIAQQASGILLGGLSRAVDIEIQREFLEFEDELIDRGRDPGTTRLGAGTTPQPAAAVSSNPPAWVWGVLAVSGVALFLAVR